MCGINGIFSYNISAGLPKREELIASRDYMVSRGPDGYGEYWSHDGRIGLGHRRLSIIDLAERASQPMASADGRYHVVFNGEIYNYPALRAEFEAEGTDFRTNSDTEILLHLYARDGERMVHRLRGMFALAIWDSTGRSLFLARDPYGIKPLYIANDGWTFRFASQVKALLAGGKVSRDPEPAGIVGFHLWGSVPEPFTLYQEIRSLPAGHTQFIDDAGPRPPKAYISITQILTDGDMQRTGHEDLSGVVKRATLDSVQAHLLADVEVGIFLSGGIDSGGMLGLMRDAGQRKVRAITLAFDEFSGSENDESFVAAEIARHYGAEHVVRRITEAEFHGDLPAIIDAMDQPSIDGINTWFVAKAARESGLKVALSGLGGDEMLAGYPSFRDVPKWVATLRVPAAIPGAGRAFRSLVSLTDASRTNPKLAGMLEFGGTWAGAYLLRRAIFLPFELAHLLDPETIAMGLKRLQTLGSLDAFSAPASRSAMSRVAALESSCYLRNQLLRDADWAGMAHGLEVRTPLVDVDLLRAMSPVIPMLEQDSGKQALADAPSKPLPEIIKAKKKTGFVIPIQRWTSAAGATARSGNGSASRTWAQDVFSKPCFSNSSLLPLRGPRASEGRQ